MKNYDFELLVSPEEYKENAKRMAKEEIDNGADATTWILGGIFMLLLGVVFCILSVL